MSNRKTNRKNNSNARRTYTIPSKLINLFVDTWNRHNDIFDLIEPEEINMGWCYQFAMVLKKIHGPKAELFTTCDHAWVKIGKKYYDSDNPRGTIDKSNLVVCFCEDGCVGEKVSNSKFTAYWAENGASGPIRNEIVSKVVRRFQAA